MELPAHLNPEIEQLFKRMDQAYARAAKPSGFVCRGCERNCCLTRFYHYTLLEYFYLHSGLEQLPCGQQARIGQQAQDAVQQTQLLERRGAPVRVMCPLNFGGRCVVYAWRPMICRLHGLPHRLHRPDGRSQTGPGCDDFYTQCKAPGPVLDRTPLYMEMTALEQRLRQGLGFNRKIKMTVAEMIVNEIYRRT